MYTVAQYHLLKILSFPGRITLVTSENLLSIVFRLSVPPLSNGTTIQSINVSHIYDFTFSSSLVRK